MATFTITSSDPQQNQLTEAQRQRALALLQQWHIVSGGIVSYHPRYDNLSVERPVIDGHMFEVLVITNNGTEAFNYWQIDGVQCRMKVKLGDEDEDDKSVVEDEPLEPNRRATHRQRAAVNRYTPYPWRGTSSSKKSGQKH